ncbi:MAG: glycoside hydrolase family 43 protein [Clostridia bacterium]|nr:glycoside hydrolase family 43 protein [Clostridia bacterium]
MQLLEINKENYIGQADPFILEFGGSFYIYTTGDDGIYAYSSDELLSGWKFEGKVFTYPGVSEFWAPSVIELDGRFYMYCSFEFYGDTPDRGGHRQTMHVSSAGNPLGPFENAKQLLHPFSIDSHVVKNESGLYIFYSTNDFDAERPGTYIVVDRLLDPFTPEGKPHTVVVPTLDEEIYMRDRYKEGSHWHTIEGAFYFREGDWQYVMYSGSCYQNEHYFIGYSRAKTDETDLTKIDFKKYPDDNTYAPVFCSNEWEEGAGHHSMIKYNGEWYAVYHARNTEDDGLDGDRRNARICKMSVKDGIIKALRKQYEI